MKKLVRDKYKLSRDNCIYRALIFHLSRDNLSFIAQ